MGIDEVNAHLVPLQRIEVLQGLLHPFERAAHNVLLILAHIGRGGSIAANHAVLPLAPDLLPPDVRGRIGYAYYAHRFQRVHHDINLQKRP